MQVLLDSEYEKNRDFSVFTDIYGPDKPLKT